MKQLILHLSEAEAAKLELLAQYRGISCVKAIKDFINASQPGGSGWVHPSVAAKKVMAPQSQRPRA